MNAPMRMSILSARAASTDLQVKHAGKIRPGIKVLTRNAESNPRAVQIYHDGVANRLKFSEIEKKIRQVTGLDNPMYPRNTPYFSVAASDFGMPEIASRIVELYGEVRKGDDQKRLYRFPVVFHSDDLNDIYPNRFKRHGGEPGYESHYGEDGERYCRYLPELTNEQKAQQRVQRITKMPRREKVVRGKCDPGSCVEFQRGQCKFSGRLLFYIPQIPSTGLLAMETSSEYAAEGIWTDLQRILDALGTLPRMNPFKPDAPVFYITKVLEQRVYFDEHGQKQTGNQWVPKLQADIDVGRLLQAGRPQVLPTPSTPVAWLASPKGMPQAEPLPAAPDQVVADVQQIPVQQDRSQPLEPIDQLLAQVEKLGLEEGAALEYFNIKIAQGWEDNPQHIALAIKMLEDLARVGGQCAAMLVSITVKVAAAEIDGPSFTKFAFAKYGKGFSHKADVLARIEAEVDLWSNLSREDIIATMTDFLAPF